jgi:hypothetical protein
MDLVPVLRDVFITVAGLTVSMHMSVTSLMMVM